MDSSSSIDNSNQDLIQREFRFIGAYTSSHMIFVIHPSIGRVYLNMRE